MWISVLFVLTSVSVGPSPLDSLKASFKNKKGFEVEFTQSVIQKTFPTAPDRAKGRVRYERPGHLVWLYETPDKRKIEYAKGELTITENEETQKITDLGQTHLQESFAFLWGETDLKNFKIEVKNSRTFRVYPKSTSRAGFKFIDVSTQKGLVETATVENNLEGQSILQFERWKIF